MIELVLDPELLDCLRYTETACVAGCCGLDAFDPNEDAIREWCQTVNASPRKALHDVRQAIALIKATTHDSIGSSDLNAVAFDKETRCRMIDFFETYERLLDGLVGEQIHQGH